MITSMLVLILIFSAIGTGIIVRGLRGLKVACDPVCANCGYDIRGYAVADRCSECGSDLTAKGAIQRNTFRASRKKITIGILVMALPWLFLGVIGLLRFIGPNGIGLRTNHSLIGRIDTSDAETPWIWNELTRRVVSGRLNAAETKNAIDHLIIHLGHPHTDGTTIWSTAFLTVASRAGAMPRAQYVALAQAEWKGPHIRVPGPLLATSPGYYFHSEPAPSLIPIMHFWITTTQISMSGPAAAPGDFANRAGQGTMPPPDINLLSSKWPGGLAEPHVHSGSYTLKFVLNISVMPGFGASTVSAQGPPSTPLGQWTETVTMPVEVVNQSIAPNSGIWVPQFAVRTDPAGDPQRSGALKLLSADGWRYRDKTIITFRMKVDHLPIPCWFKPIVKVGDASGSGPPQIPMPGQGPSDLIIGTQILPAIANVQAADLELVPDIDAAKKALYEQVWGKSLLFKNVAVKYHDLSSQVGPDLFWRPKATTQH